MDTPMDDDKTASRFHPRAYDAYYHASPRGTGSAVKIELCPAYEDTPGCIFMKLALQRSIGGREDGGQVFPTFDWAGGVTIKLTRADLSQFLQVLRGMQESIMDDKGLFHRSAHSSTVIRFAHQIEPKPGYLLNVWRKPETGEPVSVYYAFDMSEAFTLMLSLERALLYVCFGIPEHIVRSGPLIAAS